MKKMKKKERKKINGGMKRKEGRVIKGERLGRHLRGERACYTTIRPDIGPSEPV